MKSLLDFFWGILFCDIYFSETSKKCKTCKCIWTVTVYLPKIIYIYRAVGRVMVSFRAFLVQCILKRTFLLPWTWDVFIYQIQDCRRKYWYWYIYYRSESIHQVQMLPIICIIVATQNTKRIFSFILENSLPKSEPCSLSHKVRWW